MKNQNPMRNINPFGLRLQPELKAKIEEAAQKNKRSLNAEISARLEASFDPEALFDLATALQPEEKKDRLFQQEVDEIKKQYGLFQEMIALLREPPTEAQIAWAQEQMAKNRAEALRKQEASEKK